MAKAKLDLLLERLAREYCGVETLKTQRSDGLDFHDIAVWSLKSALEAAYTQGMRDGTAYTMKQLGQENRQILMSDVDEQQME